MASFNEHITRAKQNLAFLVQINSLSTHNWDWEVTVCFYTAVHLVDAHLASVTPPEHPIAHRERKHLISPSAGLPTQLPNDIYLKYRRLEGLSKRSRYMCNEDPAKAQSTQHITYDVHLGKAIKILDELLAYFGRVYSVSFPKTSIKCPNLPTSTKMKAFVVTV